MNLNELASQYEDELFEHVVPFWLTNSRDHEFGGYFTCLDRTGQVFDTDKFIWLQGRQVWLFSMLCNRVEQRAEWLECARRGGQFLRTHGHNGDYDFYFSVSRDGAPLVQPYNIFSNVFAAMGFGQLALATGDDAYSQVALRTFERIIERQNNPKGVYNKVVPGTRDLKNFALPMILCNLALEIEHILSAETVETTIERAIHEVLEVFYRPELGLIVENVTKDNELCDSFDGRLLNPGHAIEAMAFIMDLSARLNRPELANTAVEITLKTLDYAWDKQYGGIFYFLDRKGYPPQQLEWDQKLWWVHIETLVSLVKGYRLTGSQACLDWFETMHDYTWSHFRDSEYPEWFGYLNRRGEVLLPLKGGKWKGCFHLPRGFYEVWRTLQCC